MTPTRSTTKQKAFVYSNFAGIDTSRADIALENLEAQAVLDADNAHFDRTGYLSTMAPMLRVGAERGRIVHARIFADEAAGVAYARRDGGAVRLATLNALPDYATPWRVTANPSSTINAGKVVFFDAEHQPAVFDGAGWREIASTSAYGARFGVPVLGRLAIAGFRANPRLLLLSRVDNMDRYYEDEDQGEASILKAGALNIGPLVGDAESIQGLATVAASNLAVFTEERVLLYKTDIDMTLWELDRTFAVDVGTISHKTIVASGSEVLFASRRGIHSIRRSVLNGATVFTVPFSEKVTELYQQLLERVPNPASISAMLDKTAGIYHVFFPISDTEAHRLSVALDVATDESAVTKGRWTRSSYAAPTCGDSRNGRTVFGSASGFWNVLSKSATVGERGKAAVQLPVFWHGDFNAPKQSHSMFVYATGSGRVTVSATDQGGRQLSTVVFELPEDGSSEFRGNQLSQQFMRPFVHQYVGVRLQLTLEGERDLRVFALGINTRDI